MMNSPLKLLKHNKINRLKNNLIVLIISSIYLLIFSGFSLYTPKSNGAPYLIGILIFFLMSSTFLYFKKRIKHINLIYYSLLGCFIILLPIGAKVLLHLELSTLFFHVFILFLAFTLHLKYVESFIIFTLGLSITLLLTVRAELITCYLIMVFINWAQRFYRKLNLRKIKHLIKLSYENTLTGLFNRRLLKVVTDEAFIQGDDFGIILLDLNDFKNINDTYGHLKGDDVLKTFSQFLLKHTRKEDLCFRYGGDEFIIFMPKAHQEDMHVLSNRLRHQIKKENFSLKNPLTFGLGMSFSGNHQTLKEMIHEADVNLYQDKNRLYEKVYYLKNDLSK